MPDLSDRFGSYLAPSPDVIRTALTSGLIVLDTNVLLSAYRFAPKAREELLTVLRRLHDRVWIPDQVSFEFHKNRFEVIAEHGAAYQSVLEALTEHRQAYEGDLEKRIRELANRAALSDDERDKLLSLVRNSMDPIRKSIEGLRQRHGLGDTISKDPILSHLQEIFAGKVGSPFSPDEERATHDEAERRVKVQSPPGYKDATKADSHGDYFVWAQTLAEAKRRNAKFLVFVTGDTKEDWYLRVKGKTIMARPELAQESLTVAGAHLILMQTKTLLRHASEYLQTSVSPETIRQAESLPAAELVRAATMEADRARHDEGRMNLYVREAARTLHSIDATVSQVTAAIRQAREALTEAEAADDGSPDAFRRLAALTGELNSYETQLSLYLSERADRMAKHEIVTRQLDDAVIKREKAEDRLVRTRMRAELRSDA